MAECIEAIAYAMAVVAEGGQSCQASYEQRGEAWGKAAWAMIV